jgi:excisionase family DNA binding protein
LSYSHVFSALKEKSEIDETDDAMAVLIPTTPKLLTTSEAAELLKVSPRTILNWIRAGTIPYLALPSTGERSEYRIPLQGLLSSLSGNYDLARELRQLDAAAHTDGRQDEDEVLAELAEHAATAASMERQQDTAPPQKYSERTAPSN